MRPLKLSVSGFTCFKEPLELDFAGLELFAIIGQTGAGKSSILDAITYALFGETARLGSKGLEALVSLGASSMYAVLEFEASDGRIYRVSRVWSRRASEKALRFELLEGSRVSTVAEGVKIKDLEAAIIAVVGLDFAGFTRAILLPQGEFDRFLRGNAADRRNLLKGLLGLERFEMMMKRAGEIASDAKGRLSALQSLLYDAAHVTPDALEVQHTTLERTRAELVSARVALEGQRVTVEAARGVRKIGAELSIVTRDFETWQGRAEEVSLARERVTKARRVAAVLPVLASCERAAKLEGSAQSDLEKRELVLTQLRQRHANALEVQQRAVEAALEIVDLDVSIADLNKAKPALERLRAVGGTLRDADPRQTWNEARFAQLEGLRNQVTLLKRLHKDVREAGSQRVAGEREAGQATKAIHATTAQLETLKSEGTQISGSEKTLEAALSAARLEGLVAQVVQGLEIGDACPVCGEALTAIPDAGHSDVPQLEAELKATRGQLLELRGQYKATQETAKNHAQNLEKIKRLQTELETRSASLSAELTSLEREFTSAIGATEDPISAVQDARAALIAGLAAEVAALTGGAEIEPQLLALGKRKRQLEDAQRGADKAMSDARAGLEAGIAGLDGASALLSERRSEASELKADLETALEKAGCATALEARAAALSDDELQRLESFEREYTERLHSLKSRTLELREALNGQTPLSSEAFADLETKLRDLETQVLTLNRSEAQLQQIISDLQTRLRDKNRLTGEAATLETRFDVYAALAQDLKGNQFQDYLLAQVQRDLLTRASHVMRQVTHDRYTLTLEDGEFCVQDAWNGMESRSVKTLSGGESFIASLSLALALSDYLAGSKALGALFLDEGFGTLDSDALDAVTLVLETLNTTGRTVGVITHVPSLAERLPNRLMVEKAQGSSRAYWTD